MNRTFVVGVAERAVKTFGQSLLASLAVSSQPLDLLHVNLLGVLSIALGATLLSVATSLASINVGLANTPAAEALKAPGSHAIDTPVIGTPPAPVPAPAVAAPSSMGPDLP